MLFSLTIPSESVGKTQAGSTIKHMWEQEKQHRAKFEELMRKYRVRPTIFIPLWNVTGFVLGAGTALLGEKAAMACTVAVETVIVEHYNDQLRMLMESKEDVDEEILETIKKCRDEEQEHHDTGINHGAEQAPFYQALTNVIKFGCKAAISISKALWIEKKKRSRMCLLWRNIFSSVEDTLCK